MSKISQERLTTFWFYGIAVICALLVAATALRFLGTPWWITDWLLHQLSLASENNAGAWWSGMLLALLSLHAFDGCILLRGSDPGAARGWMLLAAVLLFFSFDEVGSIHERLSTLGRALSLGTWSLLFPVGAVLAAVFLRGVLLLWRAEGERRKVGGIVIGFCLLGSVAIQEFLEHRIVWQTDFSRAIRVALEEGTELLGMLILLRIAIANTADLAYQGTGSGRTALAALDELRRPLLAIGLALAPALALISAALPDQQRGHPADWLSAVAFLAAGLVLCRSLLIDARSVTSWATWVAGGLCCLASVAVVAISPSTLVELGLLDIGLRMVVLSAISILVGVTWACTPLGRQRRYGLYPIVVGVLATALLLSMNIALVYGSSQLLGLVVYWSISTVVQGVRQDTALPITSPQLGRVE